MSFEIPFVTKCCFCIPIRRGLLVLGYIGLLYSIFLIGIMGAMLDHKLHLPLDEEHSSPEIYVCVIFLTQFIIDFGFSVVLLVGAHRANEQLVRIYFYYGIISLILSFVVSLSSVAYGEHWMQLIVIMPATLITIYLLIVIRSAYIKFGRDHPVKYSANNEEV